MEPFIPLSNASKREIKELKKGSGRELIKSDFPNRQGDDCLKLESYIRSNIVYGIYNGMEVSETIMSVEMSNISKFYDFGWFYG